MPIEIEKECYNTLKAEFIQIFSSFRLLMLYQIGGFAILFYNCINQQNEITLLLSSTLAMGLIYVIHIVGNNWVRWAIRQVSYTFIFYEKPIFEDNINKDNDEYRKQTKGLWILANRAESKAISSKTDSYKVGSEIEVFYLSQLIYLLILAGIIVFKLIDLNNVPKISIECSSATFIILCTINAIIFLWLTINFIRKHVTFNENISQLTKNWENYWNNKKEMDSNYLKQ